jgi:hypothetical protein
MGFRSTNEFTCAFYGNDLNTAKYTDTDRHHWACTYDVATKNRIIYRDGVQVAPTSATTANPYQGSGDLYIGRSGSPPTYFKGLVDDVRIYPSASGC